jgi:CDP-glucose 4,6-dehydratase
LNSNYWLNKRVFVSGCNGFLGSWLTKGLVATGAEVIGLIRDHVPQSNLIRSGNYDRITVVDGDITNYELVERALAEYEVEIVFHLAAQTIVGIANRAPLSTFETNIKGTWVLLEAARRIPTIKGIVVASSDKAYGEQTDLPYCEDSPLTGQHPYDVSKSCADLISRAYAQSYLMPIVVTRFANLYGGGDLNWNRIVPGTVRSVLRGERPVIRSDGTFRRDYLYVEDAVDGYLTIAECLEDSDIHGEAFNFGLDHPTTALEMVQTIVSISDYPNLEPIILNQARNEIPDQYLSSSKAHRVLDWHPSHDLEQGLRKAMSWYAEFLMTMD